MKILFFGTKSYDREFFKEGLQDEKYKEIEIKFIEPNLTPETAELAHGYDAVCAFVNMDLCTRTIQILHEVGIKLILMRCAGFNNVDLEEAKKLGMPGNARSQLFSGSSGRACHGTGIDS